MSVLFGAEHVSTTKQFPPVREKEREPSIGTVSSCVLCPPVRTSPRMVLGEVCARCWKRLPSNGWEKNISTPPKPWRSRPSSGHPAKKSTCPSGEPKESCMSGVLLGGKCKAQLLETGCAAGIEVVVQEHGRQLIRSDICIETRPLDPWHEPCSSHESVVPTRPLDSKQVPEQATVFERQLHGRSLLHCIFRG